MQVRTMRGGAGAVLAMALLSGLAAGQEVKRFTCGTGGGVKLTAASVYGGSGYGFDLGTAPAVVSDGTCGGEKPFFFSVAAGDGDYRVTVVLGGKTASTTTVKAESRRLLVLEEQVKAGGEKHETWVVHVRTPEIAGQAPDANGKPVRVKLKPREIGALDWDDKLTLEFNGAHPAVREIEVEKVQDVPTVYLAGDSTVVDQDKEPWAAWGQMLPAFFGPGVAIANEAESGETIKSFVGERRLLKVMSTIKRGDWLMVQFAHNDQKPGAGFVSEEEYKGLLRSYIAQAREKGATAVLVTSMNRRKFDEAGKIEQTLGGYPGWTREVAASEKVGLIDLNAMSKTLFEAMGPEGTLKAFVHYPANTFPGQAGELKDDTHFNAYGAYELARCVVESIREQRLGLAGYLRATPGRFDAARPDAVADWRWPASPLVSTETPYGR